MQHIVVLTAKPGNLDADDWLINGVGRKGKLRRQLVSFNFLLHFSVEREKLVSKDKKHCHFNP